jgi:aspartate/methionine/tyrosine aminotransferase
MAQYLYEQLLEDLIFFKGPALASKDFASHEDRVTDAEPDASREWRANIHPKVDEAFSHPAITGNELPFTKESIRLDYGENYLNAPLYLKKVVLESFVMRDITPDASNPDPAIRSLLQKRFGLAESRIGELFFGSGVASLFSSLLRYARNQGMTMLFPQGAYGYFRAALDYYKVGFDIIPGNPDSGFKVGPTELRNALPKQPTPCIIYLNAPISNPTGRVYTSAELRSLIEVAWEYKSIVVIDAVFAGLEFDSSEIDLSWIYRIEPSSRGQLALLGGISKEFAGAGLRFGYLYWSGDSPPAELRRCITKDVHYTTLHSMQRLFEAQVGGELALADHLEKQRNELHTRALMLERVLTEQGWSVIIPQGGLFLVAQPTAWLGKEIQINNGSDRRTIRVDGNSITELLFIRENLAINNATWTGLKDYCRFVLSVDQTVLYEAIERLKRFGEFMRNNT